MIGLAALPFGMIAASAVRNLHNPQTWVCTHTGTHARTRTHASQSGGHTATRPGRDDQGLGHSHLTTEEGELLPEGQM